jgi:hypothetical protein
VKFSRRDLDEVREDINRARALDEYMLANGIGDAGYSNNDYVRANELSARIEKAQEEAGYVPMEIGEKLDFPEDLDPRLKWFLSWFDSSPSLSDCMNHLLSWRISGGKTCFLGDADSLILKPDFFTRVMDTVKAKFPGLERFTVYGRTSTAARKRTVKELRGLAESGLHRVHFGLESGNDQVLEFMNKGVTGEEHVTGCLKTSEAGLSCSIYVMPGLGGSSLSEAHAHDTAMVINRLSPDFIRLRTLEIFPETALEEAARNGDFKEATEEQVIREIRTMIEEINVETEILSDSASNLLSLFGSLPGDREEMLHTIDHYLSLSGREKLEFSFTSRLQSFMGQYGGITEDIFQEISPYLDETSIFFDNADDEDLHRGIRLIRSKLMP